MREKSEMRGSEGRRVKRGEGKGRGRVKPSAKRLITTYLSSESICRRIRKGEGRGEKRGESK